MPCQNCCLYYMEEVLRNIYMGLPMALYQGQYPEIHNMGSLCLGRKSHASPSWFSPLAHPCCFSFASLVCLVGKEWLGLLSGRQTRVFHYCAF